MLPEILSVQQELSGEDAKGAAALTRHAARRLVVRRLQVPGRTADEDLAVRAVDADGPAALGQRRRAEHPPKLAARRGPRRRLGVRVEGGPAVQHLRHRERRVGAVVGLVVLLVPDGVGLRRCGRAEEHVHGDAAVVLADPHRLAARQLAALGAPRQVLLARVVPRRGEVRPALAVRAARRAARRRFGALVRSRGAAEQQRRGQEREARPLRRHRRSPLRTVRRPKARAEPSRRPAADSRRSAPTFGSERLRPTWLCSCCVSLCLPRGE